MAATDAKETEHPAEAIAEEHPLVETPKQLLVLVFLSFAVPVVILIMVAILVSGIAFDAEHPAMNEQAILARIKPVGEVVVGEGPSSVAAAPAAAAPAAAGAPAPTVAIPTVPPPAPAAKAATAGAADGKAVYEKVCAVCHVAGVAGAPKFADKAAWSPRLAQGIEALHAAVIKGKGAMPPKGGATQFSDTEIRAAVEYMVGAVK
jgi:cytochrome c5